MRSDPPPPFADLEALKRKANLLLKRLLGPDRALALRAAARLRGAACWAAKSPEDIFAARDRVQHKHALDAVAAETGFRDWRHLKAEVDRRAATGFDPERLFGPRSSLFLNLWFRTYEEARAALAPGCFLFPYRSQFVVCDASLLADLGIDADDPDWNAIGRDWAHPHDIAARDRLAARLARHVGARS